MTLLAQVVHHVVVAEVRCIVGFAKQSYDFFAWLPDWRFSCKKIVYHSQANRVVTELGGTRLPGSGVKSDGMEIDARGAANSGDHEDKHACHRRHHERQPEQVADGEAETHCD